MFYLIAILMVGMLLAAATAQSVNILKPIPPPTTVRETFNLDPFYEQWIDVEGLPVVASAKVNPYAVKEAAWLIRQMIGHRQDILQALAQNNVRFVVMAYNELTTQIPAQRPTTRLLLGSTGARFGVHASETRCQLRRGKSA